MNRLFSPALRCSARLNARASSRVAGGSLGGASGAAVHVGGADASSPASVLTPVALTNKRTRGISSTAVAQASDRPQSRSQAPPPRDTRLAGRRRFYKVVGIDPASPPWETMGKKEEGGDDSSTVDSPISAGVDGTQSATGITTDAASSESLRVILDPNSWDGGSGTNASWFNVTLDGRTLRTPLGHPLTVPSTALAMAIATEWDAQEPTIIPAQMPLTTMVCTAIDQISAQPQFYRDNILRYLKNDTTCYLTDPQEDRVLYRKQMRAWEELHEWAQEQIGRGKHAPARAVGNDEGLIMSRARKSKPGAGLPHPEVLVEEAEAWVNSLDAWRLIAMQAVTVEAKSFLVGMAVVRGCDMDHRIDESMSSPPYVEAGAEAVEASRVEEEFNIEQWGLVEGGHDYDRLNASIGIHSATFLVAALNNN
jgi:ATP synthase F1 complex assembly factor 2